jgi:hypothetical protein
MDENTVAIGDFNMPDIDWEAGTSGPNGRSLLTTVQENNLDQLINFRTHIRGNILDLVITNCADKILATNEAGKLGNSDHCIIETVINAGCEPAQCMREIICWNQANFENMRDELSLIDWQAEFVNKNTEECWTIFTEKLKAVRNLTSQGKM